jgi:hypothetical protein
MMATVLLCHTFGKKQEKNKKNPKIPEGVQKPPERPWDVWRAVPSVCYTGGEDL